MESRAEGSNMPIDDKQNRHEILENPIPAESAAANAALGSRFDQMFPVLSETEIGVSAVSARSGGSLPERSCSRRDRPSPGCT